MCSKKQLCQKLKKFAVKGMPSDKKHFFVNNKAPILLVAHIDTVQQPRFDIETFTGAGFDDRLGVYIGLSLSQKYPELFDLLLTDYEELGRSTARYFTPKRKYNFVVGLDREGFDFVDYGLASSEFLRDFKAVTMISHGYGSFSDICSMDHIECSKINLGIGVKSSHSFNSSFCPGTASYQVSRLLRFCQIYKDMYYSPGFGDRYGYGNIIGSYGSYSGRNSGSYNHATYGWRGKSVISDKDIMNDYCDYCGDNYSIKDLKQVNSFVVCETCMYSLGYEDSAVAYNTSIGKF